jgi:hypothetical protein
VRHVGDRHIELPTAGEQLPAAAVLLAKDRVVEVAGVLAIDGDEGQVAQVDALLLVLLLHLGLELARFLDHRLGPDVRDIVAAQGDVDLHARRHVVADHLDDIALRLEARRRPMGDLDLDELTDARAGGAPRGDQHLLLDLRVVGDHEADAALFVVTPDDALVGATDHFDYAALAAATAVEAGHPHQGAVAVEHQAHLRRAEEQVVAAVVRHQETEAVAVTADTTAYQVELVHRRIGAAAGVDQLAVALHGAQTAAQGLELVFGMQTEFLDQLLAAGRRTALGQMRKNQFTTGDGVFVFFRLAGGLGVEGLPIGH